MGNCISAPFSIEYLKLAATSLRGVLEQRGLITSRIFRTIAFEIEWKALRNAQVIRLSS